AELDSLADWIGAAEILSRERLVDDRDLRILAVALLEHPSGEQTDAHRFEVVRRHRLVAKLPLVIGRAAPFDGGITGPCIPAQRERARRASCLDARDRAQPALDFSERSNLIVVFGISNLRQRDAEGDDAVRREPG